MDDLSSLEAAKLKLERSKSASDIRLRRRELAIKQDETRRARWPNPFVIAAIGAAAAAIGAVAGAAGNVYVSKKNGEAVNATEMFKAQTARDSELANFQREMFRAESALIFKAVNTGKPDTASDNLKFLLEAGLIQTKSIADGLREYLSKQIRGQGVFLPNVCIVDPEILRNSLSSLGILDPQGAGTFGLGLDLRNPGMLRPDPFGLKP